MKNIKIFFYLLIILLCIINVGCQKALDETPFSQASPTEILSSDAGIQTVLFSAYRNAQVYIGNSGTQPKNVESWTCDIEWSTGGAVNPQFNQLSSFTWDASFAWFFNDMWAKSYSAIRDANIVIDNSEAISGKVRQLIVAEARFIRAMAYTHLYSWYGPVILRKSITDAAQLPRATDVEMKKFIETEFTEIIPLLPAPGTELNYGRAHKAAAMGFLCKFYLNTRQWQQAADVARDIINLKYYALFPVYRDMFKIDNEKNKEMIWVNQAIVYPNGGNQLINGWFPTSFSVEPISGFKWAPTMSNWGVKYRLKDSFYNSFEVGDKRKDPIITSFIDLKGATISLLNNNNTRSFKYWPNQSGVGFDQGNDFPIIRYSDILLSRAEALNELNGPTQEAIDLINMVRRRASISDLLLANFISKTQLRDHILKERGWEFYDEAKRREDLIRQNKFIESAIARGALNAKTYHVLFPIPQQEIDANPKCVQNNGY